MALTRGSRTPTVVVEWPSVACNILSTTKLHDVTVTGLADERVYIGLVFADTKESVMVTSAVASTIHGSDYVNGVLAVDGCASFKIKPNVLSSQYDNRNFAYVIDVMGKKYYSDKFKIVTKLSRKRARDSDASDTSEASVCDMDDANNGITEGPLPLIDYDELTAMLSSDDVSRTILEDFGARLSRVEQLQMSILEELKRIRN